MEPTGEGPMGTKRAAFARQDKEGGLESVLGIVGIPQRVPADSQHHGPVPPHHGRKCRLVIALQKGPQQRAISLVA
jgi:hypothetical protein